MFKGITKDELENKKLSKVTKALNSKLSLIKELPRLPCNFPPMSINYSKEINNAFQNSKQKNIKTKTPIFKDLPKIENEINPNKPK